MIFVWEKSVKIESIDVKGKFMFWTLVIDADTEEPIKFWMHCSYGMSGQWLIDEKTSQHPVVTLGLSSGRFVTFNDSRHFGTVKFVYDLAAHEKKLASIGPDMFDLYSEIGGSGQFVERLCKHPSKTLAEALMNQSIVSGIGNYIKAEGLYAACLSPHRTVESLTDDEFDELFYCVSTVMVDSFNDGGATIRTYKSPDDQTGEYVFNLKVYGKKVDPKGNPVTREETLDGRTTWWVPEIQK